MGKGKPRAVEKGVLGQNSSLLASSSGSESLIVPLAPVYYPSDEEFKDPLGFIYKIRDEAEKFGICKIVPPKSWSPPFALNLEEFKFPTKTQAIHQLQARAASCDSKTFELEYNRFLEGHSGKKLRRKVIFEGEELDFCKLFNAAKRFGGYDKVVKEKKWGDVYRFVRSGKKISECAKHVLSQLYREHLYDYEVYYNQMNKEPSRGCKRGVRDETRKENSADYVSLKRRRKNDSDEKIKVSNKVEEEYLDQICEQCRSGLHGEVMLLCDRCNKGWHIYCLSPPLKEIPPGNWYCFECLNSDKDSFGFIPGKHYTVEAFRRLADRTKKKWFGSGSTSRVQMEKKFWEIVEGLAGEVEVMYGSDLDTSVYGSGFPRINDQRPDAVDAKVWNEYCHSPWNLNNLPKLKGSVLRAVNHNITGVMVPWLYVGMLFSSFCWHFEDHCFYSMNYHHWGEPKCWYSVPGSEASSFEKVMRDSLPDLFDAQPDLLFQLVTMLNPSVLQENGVPVYTVLQESGGVFYGRGGIEALCSLAIGCRGSNLIALFGQAVGEIIHEPGNFVITFPRSYHGGFNFGLNCAEAVNFAPADWLPYGGIGAELYKTYHKTAVISHEELLYVVAKGGCDNEVSPHLKKELLRMYSNERTWRETLWRRGVVKSSALPPRKCPDYVGAEEDPACVICKQYLYLSAIKCRCRPSAFVCLEHWRHICECKPSRLRLLYRHTLAELHELVLAVDVCSVGMGLQSNDLWRQISNKDGRNALTKKVKGGHINMSQLAEQWCVRSSKIFDDTYSARTFAVLLKEAEQFLWAGSEMDSVRDIAKRLILAQKWAESVRDCLTKIQNWSIGNSNGVRRVRMNFISKLLNFDPVPCNEPGNLKLKEYAEKAKLLIQEIGSALTSCSKLSDLESLYTRARDFPIYVKESKKLSQKISSAKVWIDNARKCLSEKCPAAVDFDSLFKLKLEIEDLQVQFPEAKMILDLARRAELCRTQCWEILSSPMSLMDVEVVLKEFDFFTVNVSELMRLKQCYSDAVSWTARVNDISMNAHQREDQNNVVNELKSLLKDGASLRIQVNELPHLEVELKKACCREKALKARDCKMPLEFIEQLLTEAAELCVEKEKLFIETSGVLAAALLWEQRASELFMHGSQMSDFEDMIRSSENISVILPSLNSIHDAVVMANAWLNNSRPFLELPSSNLQGGCSLLELETLKELVAQSKQLKISLKECEKLELVLKNCDEWKQIASSIVKDAECLFSTNYIGDQKLNELHKKVNQLKSSAESTMEAGSSIAFDFPEIPKLQNVYSLLQWCARVFSFCSTAPSIKDVESLIDAAEKLSVSCVSEALWKSLVDGVKWLRRALMVISRGSNFERCKLEAAEEVLAESQKIIAFPVIIDQVVNAIREHKLWKDKADQFFRLNLAERSWSGILELEESGRAAAFSCLAMDLILSEIRKVETWKKQCMEIVRDFLDEGVPLLGVLQKVKKCLDVSLCIYRSLQSGKTRNLCICANGYTEDQQLLTCSMCKDCYHLDCLDPEIGHAIISEPYGCPFCRMLKSGSTSQDGGYYLKFGQPRAELRKLMDLLSDAEDFSIMIEEKDALLEVVHKGLECKACLRDILEFLSSYVDNDLQAFSEKLTVVLKASKVGGVYDHQDSCDLQLLLGRYWWRVRVKRLLEGSQKPTMKQIQLHIKEGLAIGIPSEDCCWQKLTDLKRIGSEWLNRSRKVVMDSGALGLDKVFELILEGEKLPVCLEKELKLLRNRSMLYCICRKPYDDRPKVYCDRCDEWYHVDCLKLQCTPNNYVCAACKPDMELSSLSLPMDYERSTSGNFVEPKTPSPRHSKLRKKLSDSESHLTQKMQGVANSSNSSMYSIGIDQLWWRNRKPFRRAVKRRTVLESFSSFFSNSTLDHR